jgi:hypothetical protein
MRFVVVTVVKLSMLVFWVVKPCGLVGKFQFFSEMFAATFKFTWRYDPEDQRQPMVGL